MPINLYKSVIRLKTFTLKVFINLCLVSVVSKFKQKYIKIHILLLKTFLKITIVLKGPININYIFLDGKKKNILTSKYLLYCVSSNIFLLKQVINFGMLVRMFTAK